MTGGRKLRADLLLGGGVATADPLAVGADVAVTDPLALAAPSMEVGLMQTAVGSELPVPAVDAREYEAAWLPAWLAYVQPAARCLQRAARCLQRAARCLLFCDVLMLSELPVPAVDPRE